MLQRVLDVSSSVLASSLAAWRGSAAFRPADAQPQQTLILYEFEACPYCRLVREALTELDLDLEIRPCPKGGSRFRPAAQALTGRAQFPLLEDPNSGTVLQDSAQIIAYLYRQYAGRQPPRSLFGRSGRVARAQLGSLPRGLRGLRARPSRPPAQPLELFSFESSPYSRLVRERLCELELPYVLHNTGKALWEDMGPPQFRRWLFADVPVRGRNRTALLERTGRVQVPYLIDPNTGSEMYESALICAYLESTYGDGD